MATSATSLAELLQGSLPPLRPQLGQIVSGEIITKEEDRMLIDLGGAASGMVSGKELLDAADKYKDLEVGDTVEVMVIDDEDIAGLLQLSLRRAVAKRAWTDLAGMHDSGKIVKVKVKKANTGGLMCTLFGLQGFLPVSQLAPEHYPRVEGGNTEKILERLEVLVNQDLAVKIIGFDPAIKKLIFSERASMEEARADAISKLVVGSKVQGRVTGVFTYGLFLAFDGVEGLVHISEIAWGHVTSPHKYAKVGDELEAVILGTNEGKISLSIKRLHGDPWTELAGKYQIGDTVLVKVKQFVDFGMFVEVEEQIGGLIHISQIDWEQVSKEQMQERYTVNQEVAAKIIVLDLENHKIGLSIKELTAMPDHVRAEMERKQAEREAMGEDGERRPRRAKRDVSVDDAIDAIVSEQ